MAGERAGIWRIADPNLIFVVWAPTHVRGTTASEPYASAVQTESYPSASACLTISTPSPPPAPQYPRFNPSFTPPRVVAAVLESDNRSSCTGCDAVTCFPLSACG